MFGSTLTLSLTLPLTLTLTQTHGRLWLYMFLGRDVGHTGGLPLVFNFVVRPTAVQ